MSINDELSKHYMNYQSVRKANVENGSKEEKNMPQFFSTAEDFSRLVSEHATELEIPKEMFDFIKIMEMGATKHGANNWLKPNGSKSSEKDMHDSMFHHLAKSFSANYDAQGYSVNVSSKDNESGHDHLLHLACRALMLYTIRQRHIKHEDDK